MADKPALVKPQDDKTEAPRIEGEREDASTYFGLSTLGSSGLKESGGWIYEEFLPQLAGGKAARFYDEMSKNSATLGSIRQLVRDLARQVEWSVLPNKKAKDQISAKREAAFVDGCKDDMEHGFADLVSEALTMIEYGFAPCVITYKLRRGPRQPDMFKSKFEDGRFGWRSIELRAQESLYQWEFDRETRKLLAMWQFDQYAIGARPGIGGPVRIPMERLVNFRTESTKNNPEGRSFFRNCVVPYLRLKHVETIEAIGVDRELTGLPVMEVPLKIMAADNRDAAALAIRQSIERQLGSLKRHEREYLLMPAEFLADKQPSGYKFRLERSPGANRLDVVAIKNSFKTDIFQACLAQFIQLGQNASGGGSRALSSDQTDLFSLIMYALLESIRSAMQTAIDRLCMLNCVEADRVPQLAFGDIETPNLAALGTYLTSLNNAGVLVPDEEMRKYLYGVAGIPFVGEVDKVVPAEQLVTEALGNGELSIGDGAGKGKEDEVELLNGAQLASLVQVVEAMAAGTLPRDSAATILTATLGIQPGTVERILDPVQEKLDTQGPMAPGSMQPGGAPGQPGAPGTVGTVVQPHQLGDPATRGDGHGGVKSADQLIEETMGSAYNLDAGDDEAAPPVQKAGDFDESQHPRADDGKFGEGAGSGGKGKGEDKSGGAHKPVAASEHLTAAAAAALQKPKASIGPYALKAEPKGVAAFASHDEADAVVQQIRAAGGKANVMIAVAPSGKTLHMPVITTGPKSRPTRSLVSA